MESDDEVVATNNLLLHTHLRDSTSIDEETYLELAIHDTAVNENSHTLEVAPHNHLWHAESRSAYYDPAIEKSLSHAEARLYHQQERHDHSSSSAQSPIFQSRRGFSSHESDGGALSRTSSVISNSRPEKGYGTVPVEANRPRPRQYDETKVYETSKDQGQAASKEAHKTIPYAQRPELSEDCKPRLTVEHGIDETGPIIGPAAPGGYANAANNVTPEVSAIYTNIQKVLDIRHKYMRLSLQRHDDNPKDDPSWKIYPPPPEPVWDDEQERPINIQADSSQQTVKGNSGEMSATADKSVSSQHALQSPQSPIRKRRKAGQDIGSDFDLAECHIPELSEKSFEMDKTGVYQVYDIGPDGSRHQPIVDIPTIREYYMDLESILAVSSDGPSKSFAFRRLQYLEGKFSLYILLHDYQETADARKVPHRDFYNVRKVDTHVHHSSCMNQKHLLRFIKSKMKKSPDEVVMHRDGKDLTLRQVFESINLTAYDLSIDTLDMHVSTVDRMRPLTVFDKVLINY